MGDLNWAAAPPVLVPVVIFERTKCPCGDGLEWGCLNKELLVAGLGPRTGSDFTDEHSTLREGSPVVVRRGDRNGVTNFLYCRCCDACVSRLGTGGGASSTSTFMRFGCGDICSMLIPDNGTKSLASAGLFRTSEHTKGSGAILVSGQTLGGLYSSISAIWERDLVYRESYPNVLTPATLSLGTDDDWEDASGEDENTWAGLELGGKEEEDGLSSTAPEASSSCKACLAISASGNGVPQEPPVVSMRSLASVVLACSPS